MNNNYHESFLIKVKDPVEQNLEETREVSINFVSPEDRQTGIELFEYLIQTIRTLENELETVKKLLPYQKRTCKNPNCNIVFLPNRKNQKFHSDSCKTAYYNKVRKYKKPSDTESVSNESEKS